MRCDVCVVFLFRWRGRLALSPILAKIRRGSVCSIQDSRGFWGGTAQDDRDGSVLVWRRVLLFWASKYPGRVMFGRARAKVYRGGVFAR